MCKKKLMTTLLALFLLYGATVAGMYLFQNKLIYLPEATTTLHPAEYQLPDYESLTLHTTDNETLAAWWRPALRGYPTLLYFHGNAGNIGDRAAKLKAFSDKGLGVLAVSYRGYGISTGTPSEKGLLEDARTALAWLVEAQEIPYESILLYGESLGTGIAVHYGARAPFGGVILEAPYTSIADRAAEMYPFLPVRLMLKTKFDSLSAIGNLQAPLLIIHGEEDATIPVRHGRTLLETAPEPKKGVFLPGIGHNDFPLERLADEVENFAREQRLMP